MSFLNCPLPPERKLAEPDISGIGIKISSTISAGLALCVVMGYYTFAYRPDVYPFSDPENTATLPANGNFKPNPIDEYLLYWRLKPNHQSDQDKPDVLERNIRLRNALTHCMLVMCDFQLISGLSTIISGFSQLPQGITAHHWVKMTQLAWFACITHLCCLSFLRDYFYRSRPAKIWRIPAMVVMACLLLIALVPTKHYIYDSLVPQAGWGFFYYQVYQCFHVEKTTRPYPEDFINSYFFHAERQSTHEKGACDTGLLDNAQQRMVLSSSFLGLGMLMRLSHLFQEPTSIYLRVRKRSSAQVRRWLHMIHRQTNSTTLGACLKKILIYRPALALFLSLRYALDIYTSKAFEVWWLIISFVWGTLNLWTHPSKTLLSLIDTPISEEVKNWTFGQVIAIMLLLAPIIALGEGYMAEISHSTSKQALEIQSNWPARPDQVFSASQIAESLSMDDPDFDFYRECACFQTLVYTSLAGVNCGSIVSLWALFSRNYFTPVQQFVFPSFLVMGFGAPPIVMFPAFFFANTLLALAMERPPLNTPVRRIMLRLLYILIFTGTFLLSMSGFNLPVVIGPLILGLYSFMSVVYIVRGRSVK